ncbi:MAG TPA: phage holin family protein, partial [Vicinamibacteria bacterium]|nr:phage holin family protein [Vicinamibacteria bacterium]
MKILLSIVANAVALYVAAYVVPGIAFKGTWVQLLVAGALFGLLNLIVRPIALLLSLPALVLTLGLFYFVLNGLLLWGF